MVGIEAFLKCLMLSSLLSLISGCIYLLNGWTPVSVYDRTALADIVASGTVLQTFKQERTKSETYESKIKITEIFKGKDLLDKIENVGIPNVYTVGNFGDKKMCYSDISTGETYIFFLTVYKNRLSAKYDDFFGAVVENTWYTENEVYKQIGWEEWTEWSTCSASCNGGLQQKRRSCSNGDTMCDGTDTVQRHCNSFSCSGVKDFLDVFGVYKLPLGVTRVNDRNGAYRITNIASLYSPLSSVFHSDFPKYFSLLFTVKIPKGSTGYLLTLSDILGQQKLAIHYGNITVFEYFNQNNLLSGKAPSFDILLADGKWHQFAFGVKRRQVVMYFDCDNVFDQQLIRSKSSKLGHNLVFAVGPYFARHGKAFEGIIEQAVIIADPEAAQKQCSDKDNKISYIDKAIKDQANDDSTIRKRTKRKRKKKGKSDKKQKKYKELPVDWSSWSSCSVTCGTGTQTRSRYCRNNEIEVEECIPDHSRLFQNRLCYTNGCRADCTFLCANGGVCGKNNTCECLPGYGGSQCQNAVCQKACENGGKCLMPDVCFCPSGYFGKQCQNALCDFECHNGGKCIRHNICLCKRGYTGLECSQPLCRRGCQNGGKCVSKNRCSCLQGYGGRRCQKAVCRPKCKHGSCIKPDVCKCKKNYYGPQCEYFKCKRTCKNGGTCIAPNKCKCRVGYSGKWCQIGRCTSTCLNGGKCRRDKCRCPKGYKGKRCEIRSCQYKKYELPYQQTYKTLVRKEYATECGSWRWKTCIKTKLQYELVSKTIHRISYRCV